MSCDKEHISAAGFLQLVREREEALHEVQVLDAENERLRDRLKKSRTRIEILLGRMRACDNGDRSATGHELSLLEGQGWLDEMDAQ